MDNTNSKCPCNSKLRYQDCCQKIHLDHGLANTPEKLMRARFSAYYFANYPFIVNTYIQDKAKNMSIDTLQQSDQDCQWLSLEIISAKEEQVEFIAYYRVDHDFYCMHENSTFTFQHNKWFYSHGQIFEDSGKIKPQRNQACICGSSKKFKKCCG